VAVGISVKRPSWASRARSTACSWLVAWVVKEDRDAGGRIVMIVIVMIVMIAIGIAMMLAPVRRRRSRLSRLTVVAHPQPWVTQPNGP